MRPEIRFARVSMEVARARIAPLLLPAALLLTSLAIFVPVAPEMPSGELDPSWVFGINQAVAQGLSFGRDIIFTFGPYAAVYTKIFHPGTDHLMLAGGLMLAVCFYLAAIRCFRIAHSHFALLLLILIMATLGYAKDAMYFFYTLMVGSWLVAAVAVRPWEGARPAVWYAELALLYAPFALLPLIKVSALSACGAVTALSMLQLAMHRQWLSMGVIALSQVTTTMLLWLGAGQSLGDMPLFFLNAIPIFAGYTEAMATFGNSWEILLYIGGAAAIVGVLYRGINTDPASRLIWLLMFLAILFLALKAGFVRHDGHALLSGKMLLLAAVLGCMISPGRLTATALILAVFAWMKIDAGYIRTGTDQLLSSLVSTYSTAGDGLRMRWSEPDELERRYSARLSELRRQGGIPPLAGTTDIYSHDQSYLLASENRWRPRPVFQSYAAYTAGLLALNRAHLEGKNAPDNILLRLQPIDYRLPGLEDGASWPVMLTRYEPVGMIGRYLHLKKRQTEEVVPAMPASITTISADIGSEAELPAHDGVVIARIDLYPSLLGRFWTTMFKTAAPQLELQLRDGSTRSFRLVAGMAGSPFLVSPFVGTAEEFGLLYAGAGTLDHNLVRAVTVRIPEGAWAWQDRFDIEFTPLSYGTDPGVLARFNLARPVSADQVSPIEQAENCDASIDVINGISPAPTAFSAGRLLQVSGWLAKSASQGQVGGQAWLVLKSEAGDSFFIPTRNMARPDVGAYFKQPALDSSGFTTSVDISSIQGAFTLGLAYTEGSTLKLCPRIAIPATRGGAATP
jgi:hypothetical protein